MRTVFLSLLIACGGKTTSSGDPPTPTNHGATGGTNYQPIPLPGGGSLPGGSVTVPSGSTTPTGDPTPQTLYAAKYTDVFLEVAYQPTAQPYSGGTTSNTDVWQIFRDNADAIFDGKKTVTLGTPHALDPGTSQDYTVGDLLDLAIATRQVPSTASSAAFYVLFLNGYFKDSGGRQMQVLGVAIGGTTLVALFKPVITSASTNLNTRKNIEQSTLVHEFGHAVGLVNAGVPMVVSHQDVAHGAHCSNDKCTMYWENEGSSSATDFLGGLFGTHSNVLFDDDCLNDVRAQLPP